MTEKCPECVRNVDGGVNTTRLLCRLLCRGHRDWEDRHGRLSAQNLAGGADLLVVGHVDGFVLGEEETWGLNQVGKGMRCAAGERKMERKARWRDVLDAVRFDDEKK